MWLVSIVAVLAVCNVAGGIVWLLYCRNCLSNFSPLPLVMSQRKWRRPLASRSGQCTALTANSLKYSGRIIKTLVKLQCSTPCISSYNMKATMCQQCCKSGSSIYMSSLLGGYMCYYEGHIVASTWLLTTCNSQSENVLQTI